MALGHVGRSVLHHLIKSSNTSGLGLGLGHTDLPWKSIAQGVRYRKLECILTTTIKKLGKAGETVQVAPGYFRNYLMPKLLAVPNTDKYAYIMREQSKIYQHPKEEEEEEVVQKTEELQMEEYKAASKRLDRGRVVLRRLVIEKTTLRYPVTKKELVAEVLRQLDVSIQEENLQMPSDLMTLGEFEVPLRLPKAFPLPDGKSKLVLKVKIRRK